MLRLSKTTHNKAARLGLALHVTEERALGMPHYVSVIGIAAAESDEYLAAYLANDDGSFTYSSATPATQNAFRPQIRSEQNLRDLLPKFARLTAN